MPVTRSWEAPISALSLKTLAPPVPAERKRELWWLLAASLVVAAGLAIVYFAKTQDFPAETQGIAQGGLLNLNAVTSANQLLPYLALIPDPGQRAEAAEKLFDYIQRARPLPNVGALAHLRRSKTQRLLPLVRLKPLFIVRTPAEYTREYLIWIGLYFAGFYIVHLAWRWRRFRGDPAILPALHLLTGIGLTLAVSLRDPLRDTLEFSKFAWGVALGCALLLLPLLRAFRPRNFSKWVYTPLLAAFALFALLLRFGSGPTGSDSKVNLGPFQPVELIKILIVLFMAGYFAQKWEWLRELREKRWLPRWLGWLNLPRFAQALPAMCAVACALSLFFLLKDLGPALCVGFLFLAMFAVARGRAGLAVVGIALLIGGVAIGYRIGRPPTVVDRISMWLSPWDNNVRGGDQLAHSFWALSTGGAWGSGPGWGDPGMIPAGHTDLVLPAIGEEWGFAGVLAIALLFAFLFRRATHIALKAADEYSLFLVTGLATLIALEMLLISAGVLGAMPLSGVVSPFLSYGNTAMLANFLIFALILAVSAGGAGLPAGHERPGGLSYFRAPIRTLSAVLALIALMLVGRAAYFQVFHDQDFIARDTYVIAQDGVKRPERNPRLNSLARELVRGNIYDRNGLPLATSSWADLERHRAEYEKLGIDIDKACSRPDGRYYPFGAATLYLLGDLRAGDNFHASNSSLIEHDQNARLQGFRDYAELAAYVRYRHQPGNPAMKALEARDRSVRTSIDARLQLRAYQILNSRLAAAGDQKGALVVMNAHTGDVLALVSAPSPADGQPPTPDELLDRARYGLYPPGSTFKLVTAIAALRIDPTLERKTFHCVPLGDGRCGTRIPGWHKPIRDDVGDSAHGTPDMFRAITVSCNAYFAQLGVYSVGAKALSNTAEMLGIPAGSIAAIQKMLPFASYGQGPVVVSPFKMARVAATIANDGEMPEGRWVVGAGSRREDPPRDIIAPELARFIASAMRSVVTSGTGRRAMAGLNVEVAGKTGTAQVDVGQPHSWFAGFAPYDAAPQNRIAFAVVVEHGGYGAKVAAPVARDLVEAARDLGMIAGPSVRGQ
jgi:cell division protein FtsW (lipid II flippase)/cell division protein FtsI/penicillin-binding protein 2